MSEWLQALAEASSARRPCVLVTVASAKGSAPREPGAKMIVTAQEVRGTIGGGQLEHKAIEIARAMLGGSGTELRRFPLGASLGQCCGGTVNLLFEPVSAGAGSLDSAQETAIARARRLTGGREALLETRDGVSLLFDPIAPPELHVVLFGAGHVGRALVKVLGTLPCSVTWVDEREAEFPGEIPANVTVETNDSPAVEVARAPAGTSFLVMTHSHALDFELARSIFARGDYRYFGLIGSLTKRRRFEQRLRGLGVDHGDLARMVCPIGVPGIGGKEPATIAVAVAAQLLALRQRTVAQESAVSGGAHGR